MTRDETEKVSHFQKNRIREDTSYPENLEIQKILVQTTNQNFTHPPLSIPLHDS